MTKPTELPVHLAERAGRWHGLSSAIASPLVIVCALLVLNGSVTPIEEDR